MLASVVTQFVSKDGWRVRQNTGKPYRASEYSELENDMPGKPQVVLRVMGCVERSKNLHDKRDTEYDTDTRSCCWILRGGFFVAGFGVLWCELVMKKPVFKLFWLLLCMLILEGCGQRQGGKALESQASESQRQELISYEIGDAEVTITRCDEAAEGEVVIPDEIEGLPVISIGGSAFSACGGLTSITIPDSVTSIGDGAFAGCLNLNSVTILDSVTSIGTYAFGDCSNLTSITIPQAFHSEDEASRLGLDKLWPDGFFLPDSTSK